MLHQNMARTGIEVVWCANLYPNSCRLLSTNRTIRFAKDGTVPNPNCPKSEFRTAHQKRAADLRYEVIAMMQAAKARKRSYRASHLGTIRRHPTRWSILRQSQVRPIFVVVTHIFCHQSLQM